ncbi:site-specific integrase [Novosphingobium olei]|uniref:tyrosine-type recombinase/integrase n=1 Tax=Novosphingobium olei TaxID=2728851 RepID=UPI00308EB03B|nr:site-specific integrase [Novosphingobium olei]
MPAANDSEFSVQRLRGGFALVYKLDGKRVRRQLAATDRQSAEAEARALWAGADRGVWTVGRIMTSYLSTISHKPSYGRRQDAWKAMKLFWDNVDPKLIDETMCRAYRNARKVGDATARYELLQLSTALGWATTNGPRLDKRPAIWLPQQPERKTRHLTRPELKRFFAAVKADHARLYVMLGLYTMARPSAILELTWDRVDFMRRLIDFTPPGHKRTAKRRTVVPISDELMVELQKGHAARTTDHVIERGGRPVACIKKAFQAASERSNVRATPYTLRHTGAVWAAEAGVSMDELAQFMGHDDASTTAKHYARYSPGYLSKVANAIGSVA